ncbi:hypothetical protein FOZ63_010876, partial [Perkinsus olseni]
ANSLSARLPTLVPKLRMDMWIPGDAQPCPVCRGGGKGSKTKAVSADKLSARSLDRVGSTTGLGGSSRELLAGGLPSTPDVAEDGMPFPVFDAVDLEVRSKDWGGSASRGVRLGTLREIRPNTSGYDMRMQILTAGMVPKNVKVKLMLQVCKDAESPPEERELADDARFGYLCRHPKLAKLWVSKVDAESVTPSPTPTVTSAPSCEPPAKAKRLSTTSTAAERRNRRSLRAEGGLVMTVVRKRLPGGRMNRSEEEGVVADVPEAMAGSNNNGTTTTAGGALRF